MAIQIDTPTKAYAQLLNADGIPLSDLQQLLGSQTETLLSSRRVANEAAWGNGFRFTGTQVDVSIHDSIRIALVSGAGALVEDWTVSVEDWAAIGVAAAGDDISSSAASLILRSDTGTIRIGRTSANRVLCQRGTYTTTETDFNLNAYARSYDGGLLERRISPSRANPIRDIVLKTRSATQPSAPTNVTFDANGVATPSGADGWVLITDPDPAGTDPLWLAAAHNPYDSLTEMYQPEAWVVTLGGSSFRQQWAEEDEGPWTDTPPADATRLLTRVRVNGMWQTYVVRDDSPEGWTWLVATTLPANSSPHMVPLDVQDWTGFKWVEIIMRQFNGSLQGNRRSLLVPADHLIGTGDAVNLDSRYTLNLLMGEANSAWTQGSIDRVTQIAAGVYTQTFRVRAYGLGSARQRASHLHVIPGYNTDDIGFTVRVIR